MTTRGQSTGQRHDQSLRARLVDGFGTLGLVPKLLGLAWRVHRRYAACMLVARVVRATMPVLSLWLAKLIVDGVIAVAAASKAHRTAPDGMSHLWILVGLEILVVVSTDALSRVSSLVESLLGDLLSNHLSLRIMEHAATLDLQQFEDPEFQDALDRARDGVMGRVALLTQSLSLVQNTVTLVSLAAALVVQQPWIVLLLAVAVVPSFLGETHFANRIYTLTRRRTPEKRQLDYLRYVGASSATAKEVHSFALSSWLIERYRQLAERHVAETRSLVSRRAASGALLSLTGTLGYYVAYLVILARAATGSISTGTLIFLAASFRQSRDLFQTLLFSISGLYEQSLPLRDLFTFFDRRPSIRSPEHPRVFPARLLDGIRFEDVGFQYPGNNKWAIRHLTLTLRPGERVAIVGENGAGKTTVSKLLGRLYDPTEGRILVEGHDLRDYDLTDVRRAVSAIFQDFVRYDMRFDENIGIGDVSALQAHLWTEHANNRSSDNVSTSTMVSRAAEMSLASSVLSRLPHGYRQMLGRRFDDGVDLSGGEWQKVALGRAYMRDAQVVILDEPTAALDARSEHEVFQRLDALMATRLVVLVSHRFSTVRMAHRIVVLQDGQIIEQGTHDELMANAGHYADLFTLQAAGYR